MPYPHRAPRHPRALAFAAAAAVFPFLPAAQSLAFVPDHTWVGPTGGSWAVPANWSPTTTPPAAGIPGNSENATIIGTISGFTVNYNGSYTPGTGTNVITLDASSATNSLIFNHQVTNNLSAAQEQIGRTNGRATYLQPQGTNTVGLLALGINAPATGSYSLSGTGIVNAGDEYIGYSSGTGSFTHTAGTNTVSSTVNNSSTLHIGFGAASSGTYALSAGKLSSVILVVGESGHGTFTQSGGTNSVTTPPGGAYTLAAALSIARYPGSTGSYTLTGGSLTVASTTTVGGSPAGAAPAAAGGTGNLSISAGSASLAALTVWPSSHLTLAGGSLSAGSLTLSAAGAFDFSGGTFTAPLATQPALAFRQLLFANCISSTTAANDPEHRLAVGYLSTGTTLTGTLTAKLTYLGDANLDGKITPDDFALLDRGFAKHLTTWQDGDFNYDGTVNSADYLLIDRVFTQQTGTLSPTLLAQRESQFGAQYVSTLLASLPEPSTLLACGFAIQARRRRRRTR